MRRLVFDLIDAHGIFEDHPVRSPEIQETCSRRRMPPRTKYDRHAPLVQKIVRAPHVVVGFDLMVDALDPDMGSARP